MNPLRTLRGRLAGAMVAILLLALAASTAMDRLEAPSGVSAHVLPGGLNAEPYQDALVLGSFSLAALALIWLVSSWSLRPLQRVSQQAREVGPSAPAARLSGDGLPAEISPLVDAVNGALDRMAAAVETERRFTENAAHELRTPLAVLSLRLQRARQSAVAPDWPVIERDLAQMTRLVAQMLDLARKESTGRGGERHPCVNLARIAREAAAMVLPLAEAQGRALTIDLPETLTVRGNADDLRDAIRNLLENAVLHGKGAIGIQGSASEGQARIGVTDEGAGVPAHRQQEVFERFNKDSASQGTGLGLAIVREVARRHGGDAAFGPGANCAVALILPSA